eukprot:Em0637g5a
MARRDVPDQLVNLLKFQQSQRSQLNSATQPPDTRTETELQALLTDVVSEPNSFGPQSSFSPHSQVLRELMTAEQACSTEALYTKQAVEARLKAIKRTEEALSSAQGQGTLILFRGRVYCFGTLACHYCSTTFAIISLTLSELQPLLFKYDSLLHSLRCCIHFELAKVLAEDGQLQAAQDHVKKALLLDYAGEYTEQLNHFQSRVALRAQIFDTPQNTLTKAAKIIEQASRPLARSMMAVGTNPGPGDISALLIQAGDLMAPNCFLHMVSSFEVTKVTQYKRYRSRAFSLEAAGQQRASSTMARVTSSALDGAVTGLQPALSPNSDKQTKPLLGCWPMFTACMLSNWAQGLTNDAQKSFLKTAELWLSLQEPWLVCNAATYLWNHNRHLIEDGKLVDLVVVLRTMASFLKQVQSHINYELLSHISAVLACGIIQRWMPVAPGPSSDVTASSVKKKAGRGATPRKARVVERFRWTLRLPLTSKKLWIFVRQP